MNTLYAYADETEYEFEEGLSKKVYKGSAILYTKDKIDSSIIQEALNNLINDPDIQPIESNKYDKETLERGYFHASFDSKNGHSHLCVEINKHIIGELHYTFFEQTSSRRSEIGNLFNESLKSSAMLAFSTKSDIKLLIENREDLNIITINDLFKKHVEDVVQSIYSTAVIPAYFPKITIELSDKYCPGIQIVDFLLWATIRAKKNPPDKKWYSRLNIKLSTDGETSDDGFFKFGSLDINDFGVIEVYPDKYPDELLPIREPKDNNEILTMYFHAEKIVRWIIDNHINKLEQFKEDFENYNSYISLPLDHDINKKIVDVVVRLFLKCFDTLPVYENIVDNENFSFLLATRKILAQTLRYDLASFVIMNNFIKQSRYLTLSKNPDFFN